MKIKKLLNFSSAIALATLAGVVQTNATQLVRELFDNLPNKVVSDGTTLDGMTNDATSVGLAGFWSNNPTGSTGIGYKGSWSEDWVIGGFEGTILSHKAGINGQNGLLDQYTGNLNTLTNPVTLVPYGVYSPEIYATHPLAPSAQVDCNASGTYWFSARVEKNYSWSAGDSSLGIGLSTGNGATDHFVGFGVTRPTTTSATAADIGDTDYVTYGTLGQPGITGQDDTGGPYYPVTNGPAQLYNSGAGARNWDEAGVLIGRLVTSGGGACELDVVTFLPDASTSLLTNPIVWDATYTFTETNVMNHLLVWMHGANVEMDAIRMGTTFSDVVGLELIGTPVVTPSITNYAPASVTIAQDAGANNATFPMSFQWLSNSVALTDQTNSTLTLSNTTTDCTADYSVVVANYWGMLTSAPVHVVFLPFTPVFPQSAPVSITRYLGSPSASFTASVGGTPPYTYQWSHAGTNYGPATTTASTTSTLVLPNPLTLAEAGTYSLTVTNGGNGNSGSYTFANVTNTVIVPPSGSFAAAVTSLSPWGYWRLDDSPTVLDPSIADQWGNNNGVAVDLDTPTFGSPGAPYVGFSNPHVGINVHNTGANNLPCKINLPKLPVWSNEMTMVMWVNNGGVQINDHNAYGNQYGIRNNGGELLINWGGISEWDSGLMLPGGSDWAFVAWVVQPDQMALYVGTNKTHLVGSGSGAGSFSIVDSTTLNDTAGLYAPGIGRNEWPFSEDGAGAGYNTMTGTWSDVAIFYHALTAQDVTNLFVAGAGVWIDGKPDGAGNLVLNWVAGGTLQQASSLDGGFADLPTATPPYSVPLSGQKFYRVKR